MMVVSLGDCGTSVPSLFRRSRNARLGCACCCACGSAAAAVTRSIAALGQTQTFSPSAAKTPVSARKITSERTISISDLDVDDFPHDQESRYLERKRDLGHRVAQWVLDEEFDVLAIRKEHQGSHYHRDRRQRRRRNAPVRADGFDLAAQLEPLPDQARQLVEQLGQITACPLLQQHGGDEEVY